MGAAVSPCRSLHARKDELRVAKNYHKLERAPEGAEERQAFAFYCPLCMCHASKILEASCCQSRACFECAQEWLDLDVSGERDCPHCRRAGVSLKWRSEEVAVARGGDKKNKAAARDYAGDVFKTPPRERAARPGASVTGVTGSGRQGSGPGSDDADRVVKFSPGGGSPPMVKVGDSHLSLRRKLLLFDEAKPAERSQSQLVTL